MLVVDDEAKAELAFLKDKAELNHFSMDDMLDLINVDDATADNMVDAKFLSCVLNDGNYRISYYIDAVVQEGDIVKRRNLLISMREVEDFPSISDIQLIMDELGFLDSILKHVIDGKFNGSVGITNEENGRQIFYATQVI